MFRTALFAGFVAYASAQSLTTQCTNALAGVAASPDAASCLSLGSLLPIATAKNDTSIIAPINAWLTNLCGSPACSNETLAAVVTNITTGCSTELAATGFTADLTSSVTSAVQVYYPTVRKVVCLKDGSTNCITEILTSIEKAVGTLSVNNIVNLAFGGGFDKVPKDIVCSNCVKGAYNVIKTDVPTIVEDASPALSSQCGASFIDGTTPTGISQSANLNANTTPKSSALGAISMISTGALTGLGASGLVVLSTIFTFFA